MLRCYGGGATNFALVKAIYKSVSLEQIVDTHKQSRKDQPKKRSRRRRNHKNKNKKKKEKKQTNKEERREEIESEKTEEGDEWTEKRVAVEHKPLKRHYWNTDAYTAYRLVKRLTIKLSKQ